MLDIRWQISDRRFQISDNLASGIWHLASARRNPHSAIRNSQSGQTLVVMALSLLVLFSIGGLVIEVGRLGAMRAHLVNSTDAATLAGAGAMPNQGPAAKAARRIGSINGMEATTVTFPSDDEMRVVCEDDFSYIFGSLWSFSNSRFRWAALARRVGVVDEILQGARPIGISADSFNLAGEVTLTFVPAPLPQDTLPIYHFVALRWGGGPRRYVQNVQEGYDRPVSVEDEYRAVPSVPTVNRTGIVEDSDTSRALFQQAVRPPYNDNGSTYSYPNYPTGNPRMVFVPMVEPTLDAFGNPAPGPFSVTISGFAAFYISSVDDVGLQMTGRFVQASLPSARAGASGGGNDYGVKLYRLVQ